MAARREAAAASCAADETTAARVAAARGRWPVPDPEPPTSTEGPRAKAPWGTAVTGTVPRREAREPRELCRSGSACQPGHGSRGSRDRGRVDAVGRAADEFAIDGPGGGRVVDRDTHCVEDPLSLGARRLFGMDGEAAARRSCRCRRLGNLLAGILPVASPERTDDDGVAPRATPTICVAQPHSHGPGRRGTTRCALVGRVPAVGERSPQPGLINVSSDTARPPRRRRGRRAGVSGGCAAMAAG